MAWYDQHLAPVVVARQIADEVLRIMEEDVDGQDVFWSWFGDQLDTLHGLHDHHHHDGRGGWKRIRGRRE